MDARRRLSPRPWREFLGLVGGRRRFLRVHGHSMTPTLESGDVVAYQPTRADLPAPGEIVVVRDPRDPGRRMIKRVRSLGNASFAVGSDAPEDATDSRHFGSLGSEHLIGTAVWAWSSKRGFRSLVRTASAAL